MHGAPALAPRLAFEFFRPPRRPGDAQSSGRGRSVACTAGGDKNGPSERWVSLGRHRVNELQSCFERIPTSRPRRGAGCVHGMIFGGVGAGGRGALRDAREIRLRCTSGHGPGGSRLLRTGRRGSEILGWGATSAVFCPSDYGSGRPPTAKPWLRIVYGRVAKRPARTASRRRALTRVSR